MLNLLGLQAEFIDLRVQFRDICHEDDVSGDTTRSQFSTCFRVLYRAKGSENDDQYQILIDIRKRIHDYSGYITWSDGFSRTAAFALIRYITNTNAPVIKATEAE
jgi:hypothetical protein